MVLSAVCRKRITVSFVLATVLGLFAFFTWRALLPNNRQQGGWSFGVLRTGEVEHFVPRALTSYDDMVTLVTASNFVRDGFWRTHLLPNRSRHPIASLYDRTRTLCEARTLSHLPLVYFNPRGQPVEALSLNNDCVYVHYPPLADWVFGGLARAGFGGVTHFKLVASFVNCAWLMLFYVWLRREVAEEAAAVAVALAGTLPAFLQWGDALYYHSFQFLFFFAAVVCWRGYLQRRTARWFLATWLLYFLEALVSYELTMFLGITLAGTLLLAWPRGLRLARLRPVLVQALAPLFAFALHFALIASYLGLPGAMHNLQATIHARATEGIEGGAGMYLDWIDTKVVAWVVVPMALVVIVAVRRAAGVPWRRSVALLGILLVGGASFSLALPGTASEHVWMMYRHFLPFIVLLLALTLDALWPLIRLWRQLPVISLASRTRALLIVCGLFMAWLVGGVVLRNGRHLVHEIAWNRARNMVVNPDNLARSALGLVYWNQGKAFAKSYSLYAPISGIPDGEPPGWQSDPRLIGPEPCHYEIWWLDEVELKTVRMLLDDAEVGPARAHCSFAFFDEDGFIPMPDDARVTTEAPQTGADRQRTWVAFSLATSVRSRALRLTCSGHDKLALRQIEAYAREGHRP